MAALWQTRCAIGKTGVEASDHIMELGSHSQGQTNLQPVRLVG